ncbi:hypothetical protein KO527_05660 [Pseudoalteromonas sp. C2R02]|uniref:hypothetical protein n=1 Tax=Pseudoalteromonas sp. C2R02 TaxID=2841565 RepID=UPI001C0A3CF2|nr:hypothetical protein [Pseudoalteromonas sp. C2R02]MBU2968835.1 hypothetical protein [Pseudoalteromonas sp. C2R02]
MKVIFLSLAVAIVLSGCSTASNKKNEEQSSKTTLIKEIDVDGIERFSFSADFTIQENDTLKPKQAKKRRRLNPQRVQGSSKQEPVEQESKNQSSLEQKALSMLDKNLNQKKWCSYGYELDEKYWQNTTFRILGHCID